MHSTTPTTTPEKPSKKQRGGVKKSKSVSKEEAKKSHDAKVSAAKNRLKAMFESTPYSKQPPKISRPDESAALVGLKKELEMLKKKLAERTSEHDATHSKVEY